MGLWGQLIGKKAEDANAAILGITAKLDPVALGEAGMRDLAARLGEANGALGRSQGALEEAAKVVEKDEAELRKLVATAEVLMGKGDETRAAGIMAKVNDLQRRVETDKAHLEGQQRSVDLAKRNVAALEGKLRDGRQALESRKRDMGDARIERDQAKEQESLARRDAGLSSGANDLDAVFKAMDDQTTKLRQQTDNSRRNATSLGNVASTLEEDPEIKAAMAEAEGNSQPKVSLADQIAAAKAKLGKAA